MRRFSLSVPLGGLLFSAFAPVPASAYYYYRHHYYRHHYYHHHRRCWWHHGHRLVGGIDFSLKTRKAPVSLPGLPGLLKQGRIV